MLEAVTLLQVQGYLVKEKTMLVLGREVQQQIVLLKEGEDDASKVVVTVLGIHGNRVKIGIEAPDNIHIVRKEIENRER